jgi:hypothetical protein
MLASKSSETACTFDIFECVQCGTIVRFVPMPKSAKPQA